MLKRIAQVSTAGALSVVAFAPVASAQVVLPDVGADISGHITAGITLLGAAVVTALGGWFAFKAVGAGLGWARKAMSAK